MLGAKSLFGRFKSNINHMSINAKDFLAGILMRIALAEWGTPHLSPRTPE
jgi:hypothetical protein